MSYLGVPPEKMEVVADVTVMSQWPISYIYSLRVSTYKVLVQSTSADLYKVQELWYKYKYCFNLSKK